MNKYKYSDIDFKKAFKKNYQKDISLKDIDDDTILSIFNDKETLLKWLMLINKNINDYQSQIDTINNKLNNATQDIVNINGDISSINGNINSINSDITNINSDITNINSDITSINSDITNINSDITNINSDITSINSDITNINSDISSINTDIDNSIPMQLYSNDPNFNPNNISPYNKYEWSLLEEGRFIMATTYYSDVGNMKEQELTNIKASIDAINMRGTDNIHFSGAFSKSTKLSGQAIGCGQPYRQLVKSIEFDASDYNSIYKDNGNVVPNSIKLHCWLRGGLRNVL